MHRTNPLAPTSLMGHSVVRCIAALANGSNCPGVASLAAPDRDHCSAECRFLATAGTRPGKTGNAIMKTPQDFVAFGQGNMEALVKSGHILATGMQDLTKQFAATAQASMEEAMATFRAMSDIRTFQQAVELQATLARTAVEKAMSQTGQVADTSIKLASEAIAPIAGRVTLAVESFKAA